tara:strand:- start:9975 stop:10379 length:405 start_codon:yes stop_codon:yes gene_type:complete
MAKVRSTLSLSSTDVLSSSLNLTVSSSIDADSGNLSRAKVLKTAVHNDALVIYKSNDKLEAAYLYVKNLDEEKTKYIYLYQDTDNDDVFAKIGGGEFAFIPVAIDKTIKVYATRIDTMVEYGVFGLDSSAVTLS